MIMRRLARLLSLLGMILFGLLAVISGIATKRMYTGSESVYWEWDNVLLKVLYLAGILLICGLLLRAQNFLTERKVHILAILVSFLAVIFCVVLINGAGSTPDADQWYVYVAAEGFFQKDYTNLQNYGYYTVYPFLLCLWGLVYTFSFV